MDVLNIFHDLSGQQTSPFMKWHQFSLVLNDRSAFLVEERSTVHKVQELHHGIPNGIEAVQ